MKFYTEKTTATTTKTPKTCIKLAYLTEMNNSPVTTEVHFLLM